MSSSLETTNEVYHLFGFPIAHSASPALHNYLFSRLGLQRVYKLTPMTSISRKMRALCRAEDFGGASVTMPLKVSVASMLDHITDEAREIGAVNTLVLELSDQGERRLVGTNTDWYGVKNALLLYSSISPAVNAGLVIGGGGAARAAVYALASLKCAPIYLVGRDESELAALVMQFPKTPCVPISRPADAVNVRVAVGCVPAIPPVTPEELAADVCTRAIFCSSEACTDGSKRVFLDMCYKPRITPLMLHAASAGWTVVSGIEAMLEQGLAQARMWLAKSTEPHAGGGVIPHDIEECARRVIREMPDINIFSDQETSVC